jgi:hypothetical protein
VSQGECRQHSNGGKHKVRGHAATGRRYVHVHETHHEYVLQEHVQARRCGAAPAGVGVHLSMMANHRAPQRRAQSSTHTRSQDTCSGGARCACARGAWRTRGPAPPMHTTTQHLAPSNTTWQPPRKEEKDHVTLPQLEGHSQMPQHSCACAGMAWSVWLPCSATASKTQAPRHIAQQLHARDVIARVCVTTTSARFGVRGCARQACGDKDGGLKGDGLVGEDLAHGDPDVLALGGVIQELLARTLQPATSKVRTSDSAPSHHIAPHTCLGSSQSRDSP